ncbi:hypothetical protein V8E55_009671 [Tylopilus felleus]
MYSVQWFYGLRYKIHNGACGSPTEYRHPSTDGRPSSWYSRGGWQLICWGYYDDDEGNYGRDWREIERGEVELNQGVLDIHEVLFGPIDAPPSNDADAVLAYRQEARCDCSSDRWVARGIRAACAFQLSGDPEAAKRGEEERLKEATRKVDDDDDDDSEDEYDEGDGGDEDGASNASLLR